MLGPYLTYYKKFSMFDLQKMSQRDKWVTGSGKVVTTTSGWLDCESKATDERAWAFHNFYMPRGAIVEITCEARELVTNSNARISVDLHTTDRKLGGSTVAYVDILPGSWKGYSLTWIADQDGYASAVFGLWRDFIGRAQFRDVAIKIYNGTPGIPDFRGCVLRCDEDTGVWTIDDAYNDPSSIPGNPVRFSNVGCISVTTTSTYLNVNYAAFQSWSRPIANAQMDYYGGEQDKRALTGYVYEDTARIMIVNSAGTTLNPTAQRGMYINFMAFAY